MEAELDEANAGSMLRVLRVLRNLSDESRMKHQNTGLWVCSWSTRQFLHVFAVQKGGSRRMKQT